MVLPKAPLTVPAGPVNPPLNLSLSMIRVGGASHSLQVHIVCSLQAKPESFCAPPDLKKADGAQDIRYRLPAAIHFAYAALCVLDSVLVTCQLKLQLDKTNDSFLSKASERMVRTPSSRPLHAGAVVRLAR